MNSVVQREMDAEGRIRSVVRTNPVEGRSEKKVYDYDHVYYEPWDATRRRGFCVEEELAYEDGTKETTVYRWYEPAGNYLLANRESPSQRVTAEFFADSVRSTSSYYDESAGQWVVIDVVTDYYRVDGYRCTGRKTLSGDGSASGNRTIIIEAGDSVTRIDQDYDADTDQWVNSQKSVSQGTLWESPLWYDNYYYFIDGQWELSRIQRVELVATLPKARLYKANFFGSVGYYAWFEGDESPVALALVDDDTYVSSDSSNGLTTYIYYDTELNVKAGYRVKECFDTPFGEQSDKDSDEDFYTVYVLQPDGTWKQKDSFEYSAYGYTVRYTFTAQGYPDKIVTFATGAPETILKEQRYIYNDKGYVVENYTRSVLRERETFELMADGWVSDITRRYNTAGDLTKATRTDTWKYCSRSYTWDKDTDTFTLDQVYANDDSYEEADGTMVYVSYEADGDQVVPVTKREVYYYNDDDGYSYESRTATYHRNPTTGEWVGEECESRYHTLYDFDLVYGRDDLIDSYDDGEDNDDYNTSVRDPRLFVSGGARYSWDETAKSWTLSERYGESVTAQSDNSITVVSYGSDETVTRVYERNAEGRITKETETKTFADEDREDEVATTAYTYTPEGWVLTKEETAYGQTTTETYTYERRTITITVTGIGDTSAATATLTVDGLAVSAPGQTVRLFNVRGAEVAMGEGGVRAPRAGLYIVKVGNASVKVVLR